MSLLSEEKHGGIGDFIDAVLAPQGLKLFAAELNHRYGIASKLFLAD